MKFFPILCLLSGLALAGPTPAPKVAALRPLPLLVTGTTLTWPAQAKVTSYKVYEHMANGTYRLVAWVRPNSYTFPNATVTAGKLYAVSLISAGGESQKSPDIAGLPVAVAAGGGWTLQLKTQP